MRYPFCYDIDAISTWYIYVVTKLQVPVGKSIVYLFHTVRTTDLQNPTSPAPAGNSSLTLHLSLDTAGFVLREYTQNSNIRSKEAYKSHCV